MDILVSSILVHKPNPVRLLSLREELQVDVWWDEGKTNGKAEWLKKKGRRQRNG